MTELLKKGLSEVPCAQISDTFPFRTPALHAIFTLPGDSSHLRTISLVCGRDRACQRSFFANSEEFNWHIDCPPHIIMETHKVRTCFTITFTDEQYTRAKYYVEDMKRHPDRIFWRGKEGKTDDELIIEQIAHRILSGFYNDDPLTAGRQIMRMDSTAFM